MLIKIALGIFFTLMVLMIMATYPVIAVSLTAIVIVALFLIFKNS